MPLPPPAQLRTAAATLKKRAKALEVLAAAVDPPSAARLGPAWAAWEKLGAPDLTTLDAVPEWLAEERAGRRERLSAGLRAGCERDGIELLVLTRDPLELRLPPVGVTVDVERDRATLTFGRQDLAVVSADPAAILAARAAAVAALDGAGWSAPAFHAQLLRAWQRAAPNGDWAELADVLPELVFLRQPKAFRADPSAKRFEPYSRAQLCYDLWRLRRDRALTSDGWRLTVAPATGASVKDRTRVFWLEDDRGQGQWHLAVRFVREANHGG